MKFKEKKEYLESLCCNENNILLLNGYESALVGYDLSSFVDCKRAIYDYDKCIKILIKRDGMTIEQAEDFFDYNTLGAINSSDPKMPLILKKF